MGKTIAAVAAGFVLWSVLWAGGTSLATGLLPELLPVGERIEDPLVLLTLIAASAAISIVCGYAAAAIAGRDQAVRAVAVLAGILLAVGTFAEVSAWDATPVWYHIVFLALLVPATIAGGRFRSD